jgi:branched-chain amino acid transport system permease protein
MERPQSLRPLYGLLCAALIVASVPLFVSSDYFLTVFISVLYGVYLCICWNLVFGYTGLFSLCHQAFLGIGAYTSTILFLNYRISPWFGMFAGALISTLLASGLTFICYRYRVRGLFFGIVTLAFAFVIQYLFMSWDYVRAAVGIYLVQADAPWDYYFIERYPYYWIILALVLIGLVVTFLIERSYIGYYLKAIREDEDAAEALGVPSSRYKILIMAVSAFLISLGGTFYAQFYLYIHPENVLSFGPMVTMQVGTMAGGAGKLLGPVIGWMFFGFFDEALSWLPIGSLSIATITRITYGTILMVVVIFLPTGMIGLAKRFSLGGKRRIGTLFRTGKRGLIV